jgi:hypothetical protein
MRVTDILHRIEEERAENEGHVGESESEDTESSDEDSDGSDAHAPTVATDISSSADVESNNGQE